MGGDPLCICMYLFTPSLPLCMRYQRSRGSALGRGPFMGGDPSLPVCMRYQGSRGSALGRGPLDPLQEGKPYAFVCIYSGGAPHGRDPYLPFCMRYQRSRGSALRKGPLMGGDPSLLLCMRYQGSRGSTLRRGPPDPSQEGTPYALVFIY